MSEMVTIPGAERKAFPIALGTWAIGGWMWGGTKEEDALKTLRRAIDETKINVIDTAPVYGFGASEELVGKAIKNSGKRYEILIATKAGLEWTADEKVYRNSSPERLRKELEASLKRLRTDYIDIYQIHWPDGATPIEETAEVLQEFYDEGKIRAIGVCNYSADQMEVFRQAAPLHTSQPPYNLFEREAEQEILPYCRQNNIVGLTYGALCRGLLSGKMTKETTFRGDDIRKVDPKFQSPRFEQYLEAVQQLDEFARKNFQKRVIHLAVRWILEQPGVIIPIWGARKPDQLTPVEEVTDFSLLKEDLQEIYKIIETSIKDPEGPEFMAPPESSKASP